MILRELNQISIACLFKGCQEQSFFPSNTLIYGISRDGSKNFNVRTCEHDPRSAQDMSTSHNLCSPGLVEIWKLMLYQNSVIV